MQQHHYPFLLAGLLGIIIVLGFYFMSVGSIVAPTPSDPAVLELVDEQKNTESTEQLSTPAPSKSAASVGGQRVFENGIAVTLVYLTSKGFSPNEITISAGEEVRFINVTDGTMRIGTDGALSTAYYTSFAQPNPVGKGGEFQIGLTRQGLWTYKNLNAANSGITGVVYIR